MSKEEWNKEFSKKFENHRKQNKLIIDDFLCQSPEEIKSCLKSCKSILEFGCGTGDALNMIKKSYDQFERMIGIDISEEAIKSCKVYETNFISYRVHNFMETPLSTIGEFDLAFSSNVLEHFVNPYPVIDSLLTAAKKVIVLVPFKHIEIKKPDNDNGDGYLGHVSSFDFSSFKNYNVISQKKFKTSGWSVVTNHVDPWQLVVLFEKK